MSEESSKKAVECDFCGIEWNISTTIPAFCGTDDCFGRALLAPIAQGKKYVREICRGQVLRYHCVKEENESFQCKECFKDYKISNELVDIICKQRVYRATPKVSLQSEMDELRTQLDKSKSEVTAVQNQLENVKEELKMAKEELENERNKKKAEEDTEHGNPEMTQPPRKRGRPSREPKK